MDIADGKFSLPMPVLLHVATARAVVSRGVSPRLPPLVGGVAPRRRTENRAARLTPPVHGTAHAAYHLA